MNHPPPLSGGLTLIVLSVIPLTTYNVYSAYKRALANGRKNVRFISLQSSTIVGNPVTTDTGAGFINMMIR